MAANWVILGLCWDNGKENGNYIVGVVLGFRFGGSLYI